jgi:NAD(P)-dependent dehydrogenase (short-subunit alcohol dehydrogenase family)
MMDKVLLVTGGARGIGAATARLAAARGYAVAVNYRERRDRAEALVRELEPSGARALAVRADVAVEREVEGMFEEVDQRLGRLTHLVNSAGVSDSAAGPVAELRASELERLMAVNVVGLMLCCREAVRRMSTARGGRGGAIVNVSSMAAAIGGRTGRCAYAGSKGAVDSFTIGLAREVAREGIRVNVLRPGMTRSDMTAEVHDDPARLAAVASTIAMGRTAEAEEMAGPIVWLLSDEASFISGATLNASGGGFVIAPVTS